jgi:hypothetical protein
MCSHALGNYVCSINLNYEKYIGIIFKGIHIKRTKVKGIKIMED